MGHRANFVIVEGGEARAFEDQWAALGCTFVIADGPEECRKFAESCAPAEALLDWAFAEGGYLLDFDERKVLFFGFPEAPDDLEEEHAEHLGALMDAAATGWEAFLRKVAPAWRGWTLIHDGRGVDVFGEHLQRRGIDGIGTEPPSFPDDLDPQRTELKA